MYKKVSTDMNFVEREKEVEKFWDDENIFQKSMDRSGKAARPCRDPEDGCSKPSGCAAGRRGQACYAYAGKPCRAGTGQTGGFAACGEGFGCIKAGFRKREGGKGTAEKCFLSEKQGG